MLIRPVKPRAPVGPQPPHRPGAGARFATHQRSMLSQASASGCGLRGHLLAQAVGGAHLGMEAKAVLADSAHGRMPAAPGWRRFSMSHVLVRSGVKRNAVHPGCHLQGRTNSNFVPTTTPRSCAKSYHMTAWRWSEYPCTHLLKPLAMAILKARKAKLSKKMAVRTKVLLIFLVLWLPIKPAVALVMPFCDHGVGMASHEGHQLAPAHHGQVPQSKDDQHERNQPQKNACGSPVLCHLVSSAIISSISVVIEPDSDKRFLPNSTSSLNEIVPDGLERPPRAPLA